MHNFITIIGNLLNLTLRKSIIKNIYFTVLDFKFYKQTDSNLSFQKFSHLNLSMIYFTKVDIIYYKYHITQKLLFYFI